MVKHRRAFAALLSTLFLAAIGIQAPTLSAQTGCTFVKGGAPTVYFVDAGTKRPIPDWSTYLGLGGSPDQSNLCTIPDADLAAIPTGSPVSAPAAARNIRYSNNFDSPTPATLPTASTTPGVSLGYVDGEYFVKREVPEAGLSTVSAGYRYFNASVALDVRLTGDTEQRDSVLGCRRQAADQLSGYVFAIQPGAGSIALGRFEGGTYQALVNGQPSPAVQRDNATNHLELTCSGTTIVARVNGVEVASAQDGSYSGGRMFMGVGSLARSLIAEARFDNLAVWESPPPDQVGRMVRDEGYAHAAPGTSIQFENNPPSSGTHYAIATPAGIYAEPQPKGSWVHSLEHGYVVILYNCPSDCPELVRQLTEFYESTPKSSKYGYQKLIVQPYREMQHLIAIIAWDYVDELDQFDAARLLAFYNAYYDRGPEDVP